MKIWVCRSGVKSTYIETYIENNKIYLPWNGYEKDFNGLDKDELIELICNEKRTKANDTATHNWYGQIVAFSQIMNKDDIVIIPNYRKKTFLIARIIGDYEYNANDVFFHSRKVKFIGEIKKSILSQILQYTLGAYRTVFQVKKENHRKEILKNLR